MSWETINEEVESLETEREFTDSRPVGAVVHSDGTTYYADGDVDIDSGTDPTTVIQAALDAVPAGSAVALHHSVNGAAVGNITVPGQTELRGPKLPFTDNDPTHLNAESGLTSPVIDTGGPGAIVRDLKITGNEGSGDGENGVQFDHKGCIAEGVLVEDLDGTPFSNTTANNALSCRFIDCRVQSCGGYGFDIQDSDTSIRGGSVANADRGINVNATNAEISGTNVFLNGVGVFVGVGGDDCRFTSIRVNDSTNQGVISEGSDNSFVNCTVRDNGGKGVEFRGDRNNFHDGVIRGNDGNGYFSTSSHDSTLSGSIVRNNGQDSGLNDNNRANVHIFADDNMIVGGCRITGGPTYGIRINSGTDNLIDGVNAKGNTNTNISDGGTNTVKGAVQE